MGTIIATRKPNKLVDNAESIFYDIKTYPIEVPANYKIYTAAKSSFTPGQAQDLSIDLSVFAYPNFNSNPQSSFPTTIESPSVGTEVGIEVIRGAEPTLYYNAFYGWEVFGDNTLGITSTVTKNVVLGSKQYVTANLLDTASIVWRTDTGKVQLVNNPNLGLSQASVFPVLLPSLSTDSSDNIVFIEGKNTDGDTLWTLTYLLQCAWDDAITIAFINRYGVWETFDCIGRVSGKTTFTRESYRSVLTGGRRTIGSNGRQELDINTGFVDEGFYPVLEEALLSDAVVVYTGDSSTYYLEPTSKSIVKQTQRVEQMINYAIKFKKSTNIIPTV